jgi:IPT/TIG domain
MVAVVVAGLLVVLASVALAASLTGNGSPAPAPSTVATPAGHTPRPAPAGHGPSTAPTSTTTSPTVAPTPGGAPVISSLDPASGTAGQGIQISGANFLSSSGQITATFNGQVAPTTCPAQGTCTVTVPPLPGTRSAQVVITTSAGTSNPVTFTYS